MLLCEKRFPLKLKEAVFKNDSRPAILYGSKVWCLKEFQIEIWVMSREIYGDSNVCRQLKDRKKS